MKKILALLMTLVMVLGLCACSPNSNETASNGEEALKMRYIGLKVYDPVYIALDKGFFEEENIDVELLEVVAGGATAIQMVSGGNAEACLNSYMALSNAVNNGMSVKAVADIQSSFEEAPLEEFFVRKDSGINSVEDLKGKKIAPNIQLAIAVPGSGWVKKQAEAEGLDKIFIEAGFEWRQPGCSMCLAMNDDKAPQGVRVASTSNRNFVGRQGKGSRTHLMSPATAAATAVAGYIVNSELFK